MSVQVGNYGFQVGKTGTQVGKNVLQVGKAQKCPSNKKFF